MRRSHPEPPPPPPTPTAWLGLAIYVLLIAVPAVLKVAHYARLATVSWWWVLIALWLPWVLVVLGFLYLLAVRLVKGQRG